MEWKWKRFSELSAEELYALLQLRSRVFVVEQNCIFLDADGRDAEAWHLMGFQKGLVAYLRAFPPGLRYAEASIGRVVTNPDVRAKGLGKELMKEGLARVAKQFARPAIRISAQSYLEKFYRDFGFEAQGEEYLEDDIPHREMLFRPN